MGFWKDLGKSILGGVNTAFGGLPGALIQGGIGLAGSLFESHQSKKAWQAQNAYNDPAMQMERYKAAGLNPNLVYSQGSPGNATSSYQAPKMDAMSKDFNLLQQAQMVYGIRNQNKEVDASVDLKKSQAEYYRAMKDLKILDHEYYNQVNPFRIANTVYQGDYLQAMTGLTNARKKGQMDYNSLFSIRKDQASAQLRLINRQIDSIDQNINESISRVGYNNTRTQNLLRERDILIEKYNSLKVTNKYLDDYLKNRNKYMGLDRLIGLSNSYNSAISTGYNASQFQLPLLGKFTRGGAFNDFLDSMSKRYNDIYDDYFAY